MKFWTKSLKNIIHISHKSVSLLNCGNYNRNMICGTYKLSQTRRERADERETSHSRRVSTANWLPSTVCVCVWWRAPFINQPSSSQVQVRTGTLQNSNSLSSFIYQLTNPKEATQTDTLTDQKWTPVSRCVTTLNARGEEGGYDRGRVPCFAPEVVLSNCIPCARWWGELVVIGPRVALRATQQIRQECKKASTTSVQDRVEHRPLLVQDISVVGVFASLSIVLKKTTFSKFGASDLLR